MSMSMIQSSAPLFMRMLGNLSALLDKAQAHADAKKFDSANYLQDPLLPRLLECITLEGASTNASRALT